jgi:hypothetical protein
MLCFFYMMNVRDKDKLAQLLIETFVFDFERDAL